MLNDSCRNQLLVSEFRNPIFTCCLHLTCNYEFLSAMSRYILPDTCSNIERCFIKSSSQRAKCKPTLDVSVAVGASFCNPGILGIKGTVHVVSTKDVGRHRCLRQVTLGWVRAAYWALVERHSVEKVMERTWNVVTTTLPLLFHIFQNSKLERQWNQNKSVFCRSFTCVMTRTRLIAHICWQVDVKMAVND